MAFYSALSKAQDIISQKTTPDVNYFDSRNLPERISKRKSRKSETPTSEINHFDARNMPERISKRKSKKEALDIANDIIAQHQPNQFDERNIPERVSKRLKKKPDAMDVNSFDDRYNSTRISKKSDDSGYPKHESIGYKKFNFSNWYSYFLC